jgi:hypothetical protein
MNGSTLAAGFPIEPLEESDDGVFVVCPIKNVPRLDDHQVTPDPAIPIINGACHAERPTSRLHVTMQIPDGHDPLRGGIPGFERLVRRGRAGAPGEHGKDHEGRGQGEGLEEGPTDPERDGR